MEKKQYFSLVTDRINELHNRLEEISLELENEDNKRTRDKLILEKDVITEKIKYLKNIESLPLYISISRLSKAEIIEMETRKHISFNDLLNKLHIDKVSSIVNSKKAVTLGYLKEAFLDDYDAMIDLIELQSVNFSCNDRINLLYNSNSSSLQQLGIASRRLDRVIEKQNKAISGVLRDYDILTIKEIKKYINNPSAKLSKEFILKHKDKIVEIDPSMEKTINKLNKKDKFGFLTKLFSQKRNKKEQECLNKIIEYYNKDERLESLGISNNFNIFGFNNNMVKKFIKKLDKAIAFKRNEVNELKKNLEATREISLSEIKSLEATKCTFKSKFSSLIHSKSNFIPKMFEDQLWNEPELRDSLIRTACLSEEKALIRELQDWSPSVQEIESLEENQDFVRKLTA